MIDIKDSKEPCFAEKIGGGCWLLFDDNNCGNQCPFYKPSGCEDWIKLEKGENKWLIPMEEVNLISKRNYMRQKGITPSKSDVLTEVDFSTAEL